MYARCNAAPTLSEQLLPLPTAAHACAPTANEGGNLHTASRRPSDGGKGTGAGMLLPTVCKAVCAATVCDAVVAVALTWLAVLCPTLVGTCFADITVTAAGHHQQGR